MDSEQAIFCSQARLSSSGGAGIHSVDLLAEGSPVEIPK